LGALLIKVGASLIDRLLRLLDLGLGFLERGCEVPRIHYGHDLSGFDHIALVNAKLENAAGEFGVNIDRVRLNATVAVGDPGRQGRLTMYPPIDSAACPENKHAEGQGNLCPATAALRALHCNSRG
jgi:hypothetical protein